MFLAALDTVSLVRIPSTSTSINIHLDYRHNRRSDNHRTLPLLGSRLHMDRIRLPFGSGSSDAYMGEDQ